MKIKLILLTLLITLAFAVTTYAGIPHVMNYQGKATNREGAPLNGSYNLTFRIYNTPTGGTAKWSETQTNIAITNGVFQVMLGSVTPLNLPFDENYWISLEINNDSEMSPRTKLASVPYAYVADKANSLDTSYAVPMLDSVISRGFEGVYVSPIHVMINPGTLSHGQTRVNKTSSVILDISQASDYWDGNLDRGPGKPLHIYCDNSGTIKLSESAPDKADTAGNTTGQKYYWYDGSKYWRWIWVIHLNAGGEIDKFMSINGGRGIKFLPGIEIYTNSMTNDNWVAVDLSSYAPPSISRLIEIGMSAMGDSGNGVIGLGARANGEPGTVGYLRSSVQQDFGSEGFGSFGQDSSGMGYGGFGGRVEVPTDTSGIIEIAMDGYAGSGTYSNAHVYIHKVWFDAR